MIWNNKTKLTELEYIYIYELVLYVANEINTWAKKWPCVESFGQSIWIFKENTYRGGKRMVQSLEKSCGSGFSATYTTHIYIYIVNAYLNHAAFLINIYLLMSQPISELNIQKRKRNCWKGSWKQALMISGRDGNGDRYWTTGANMQRNKLLSNRMWRAHHICNL